jgi:hypothetical protein
MNLPGISWHQNAGRYGIQSPQPGAAAALAFDDFVALFQETLAFAILALLLFLDVGTFVIGHDRKSPRD